MILHSCGDCAKELEDTGYLCDAAPPTAGDLLSASCGNEPCQPFRCAACHQKVCTDQNHPEDCETLVLLDQPYEVEYK